MIRTRRLVRWLKGRKVDSAVFKRSSQSKLKECLRFIGWKWGGAIIWCDKRCYYLMWQEEELLQVGRSWHLSLQVFAQLFMLWWWWWFLIDGAQSRGVLSRKQKERGQNKISAGGFRSQLLREDITRKKCFLSGIACKGDQLLTNCWPLGDHLVTTCWPLGDHLVTTIRPL